MTVKEMDALTAHFNKYFRQNNCTVLHPIVSEGLHIDALLYSPTEQYPFWKLVSMGASDYKMNSPKGALGNRNEYIMAIHPDEDMTDIEVANWYYNKLIEIASYPAASGSFITYGHSLEWAAEDGEEMIGAFLEFPQMVGSTGILRCKLGMFKTVVCLLAVLINRAETDRLLENGPEEFSNYLFPEADDSHFFSERSRSDRF